MKNHSGFALLMMLVVLLGFTAVGLSGILSSSVKQKNELKKIENVRVLREAKEALLSYAVDYAARDAGPGGGPDGNIDLYRMGRLPCPDYRNANGEGAQDTACGALGVNMSGYFPYRTIGKGKMEDSANECLWYVVSGEYKNAPNNMVNWDSVGYLNLVDEDGNLQHGAMNDDFPIAFIISPGATINQDRTPVPDGSLPTCQANRNIQSYLEGGPNINYTVDLLDTADTLWTFLTTPEAASLDDVNYNDQVIAIYKNELWDRIRQLGDLSFDNSDINIGAADPVTSRIELLTQSLAECIAAYGNANLRRLLPYPAPLLLADYRVNNNYDDDPNPPSSHYGRFPQVVDESITLQPNFVFGGPSYCIGVVTTPYDELFWKNWKDHFFYVVSADFNSASATPANESKCDTVAGGLNCFTVDFPKPNKIAAIVIFAGPVQAGQNRIWWWDDATAAVARDDKLDQNNYLDGGNQLVYAGGVLNYLTNNPPQNDYMYCIEYDNNPPHELSAIKCADL